MDFHLLHYMGTMDFDRLLHSAEFTGNLFVQFAGDDVFEHFALTRCQRGQARADLGKFSLLSMKGAILLNCHTNSCEKLFIVDRFGEEIASTFFHGLDAPGNITRTSQKNNGQKTACFGQDALELETIEGGHSEIEHETARCLWIILRQKFLGRAKCCDNKASRV